MKRMHFKNRRSLGAIGPAIVMIVLAVIGIVAFSIPKTPKWIETTWIYGILVIAIYLFLMVYVRHYFKWNEKEATLKSEGFLGKRFRFEDVVAWEHDNYILKLKMKSHKIFEFNLTQIGQSDKDKLFTHLESLLKLKKREQPTT